MIIERLNEIESNDWITAKEGAEYCSILLGHKNSSDSFINWAKYWGIRTKVNPGYKRRRYSMDDIELTIGGIICSRRN